MALEKVVRCPIKCQHEANKVRQVIKGLLKVALAQLRTKRAYNLATQMQAYSKISKNKINRGAYC